jgi:uncharacterized membrane protein (UPF0127 family)
MLAGFALSVLANASDPATNPTERCTLYFSGGVTLADVPVARTPVQMTQGLMFRDDVDPGMLFSWPSAGQRVFWMRNTPTPLSLGFISADGTLFSIEDMAPNTDEYHYSPMPASDALELPGGAATAPGRRTARLVARRSGYCRTAALAVHRAAADHPSAWAGVSQPGRPRRYQSGEVDYNGHISRPGDAHVRSLLYEAAVVILTRSRGESDLRNWGIRLREKIGFKRSAIAVARKLAVIMHAMLRSGEFFVRETITAAA